MKLFRRKALVASVGYGFLRLGGALVSLLPPRISARLASFLVAKIGPRLSRHRWVLANFSLLFPDRKAAEIEAMARTKWRNMGYVVGELPHLSRLARDLAASRIDHYGVAEVLATGKPSIYISAHIGNWEILARAFAAIGVPLASVHQPVAASATNRLLHHYRVSGLENIRLLPRDGVSRNLIEHLQDGWSLLFLLDTRMKHKGAKPVNFFGHDMQVSTLAAKLAWRFDCDLVPTFCKRLPSGRLVHEIHSRIPVPTKESANRADWVLAVTSLIYSKLESEIRQDITSWLCTSRRWDKSVYRQNNIKFR